MPSNFLSSTQHLDQLQLGWHLAVQQRQPNNVLPTFFHYVQVILDQSPITRQLHDDDLTEYLRSPYEQRGVMRQMRPWRTSFFRLTLGELLIGWLERDRIPLGRTFWLETFPRRWCDDASDKGVSFPPPISPSESKPGNPPLASSPEYLDWAATELPRRIKKLGASSLDSLLMVPYEPTRQELFNRYAHAISVASVILLADKLGLGDDLIQEPSERLVLDWLNPAIVEPFQFRYRGDSQLWPDLKRVYVDLQLSPIFGQVLTYEAGGWEGPHVTRSLSLLEANTRTVGDAVVHTGLRRVDMELAVWCESMWRMLPKQERDLPATTIDTTTLSTDGEITRDQLPTRFQQMAAKVRAAMTASINDPSSNLRFSLPEAFSIQDRRKAISSPPLSITNGTSIIPPELARPVLENQTLSVNLDWEWVAPNASWMDLRIVALVRDGSSESLAIIEYDELENTQGQSRIHLKLHGKNWEDLLQNYPVETIRLAFQEMWFARRVSGLDTGVITIGVFDLMGVH